MFQSVFCKENQLNVVVIVVVDIVVDVDMRLSKP